ncbi:succinylglutamate desuccinylase/aspartoacylase family protein [Catenovulum maritimum]|uniref:Succinylglutamate desuccinylase n=1 Tax=Catenovulum maritimum TaxID=1513271 RepID=A0A0J8JJC2_9ALTE|nr:succinylglutamate desuccinylase/aspartoacylase family protein [Catenovulum maritimum]KMT64521.1 succinylglutamate desuccinylase [Catenovulum maritimum]
MADILQIGEHKIGIGQRVKLELPVASLYSDIDVTMPVEVIRARKPGPTLFISAAIHGDELNGIEIVRRLLLQKSFKLSKGTLIAVPVVNVHGLLNQSRYLPDRRDLNRSFPGSAKGSLAGRLAHLFLNEIVHKCDYGIDLHTGAIHRSNYPQVRANLADEETQMLARAFGVPVLLNSDLRDGSLRQIAAEEGTKILLYEAGQALRFDELSIRAGIKGIMNVMVQLGMLPPRKRSKTDRIEPFVAYSSSWVRASTSGMVRDLKKLGQRVKKGEVLAEICSPNGSFIEPIVATRSGIIIGKQNIPLVQEGSAMYHVANFEQVGDVVEHIEQLNDAFQSEGEMLDIE